MLNSSPEESETGLVPLLPSQLGFFHSIAPQLINPSRYTMSARFPVSFGVSADKVERAVAVLLQRHIALSALFYKKSSTWVSVLPPPPSRPDVLRVDLSRFPDDQCEQAVSRIETEVESTISVGDGVLVRFVLVELGRRGGILCVCVHHLVCDLASMLVLRREFERLLTGWSAGAATYSYRKCVASIDRYARSAQVVGSLEFWTAGAKLNRAPFMPVTYYASANTMATRIKTARVRIPDDRVATTIGALGTNGAHEAVRALLGYSLTQAFGGALFGLFLSSGRDIFRTAIGSGPVRKVAVLPKEGIGAVGWFVLESGSFFPYVQANDIGDYAAAALIANRGAVDNGESFSLLKGVSAPAAIHRLYTDGCGPNVWVNHLHRTALTLGIQDFNPDDWKIGFEPAGRAHDYRADPLFCGTPLSFQIRSSATYLLASISYDADKFTDNQIEEIGRVLLAACSGTFVEVSKAHPFRSKHVLS